MLSFIHARPFASLAVFGCLVTAHALADRDRCGPVADVESLKAELQSDPADYILSVKYEVEIEKTSPDDRFELELFASESGRRITDSSGQGYGEFRPLDAPSEYDGDEREYKGCAAIRVPRELVGCAEKLRIHAVVRREGEARPLDCEDSGVHVPRCRTYAVEAAVEVVAPATVVVERPYPPVIVERPCPPVIVERRCPPAVVVVDRPRVRAMVEVQRVCPPRVVTVHGRRPEPVIVRERHERRGGVSVRVGARW